MVFKIVTDPYVGRLAYFRVYSGHDRTGACACYNATKDRKERIGRILRMHADHREEIEEVRAGDIAATLGLKNTFTGETLCAPNSPIILESIDFPEPVISLAIEPKTNLDQDKMGIALRALAEEDPTFQVRTDEQTGQTIFYGMGELHLEVLIDRMLREFKVAANVGRPRVAYRETITDGREKVEGRFVRQTGGRGQYGHVVLRRGTTARRAAGLSLKTTSSAARFRRSSSSRSKEVYRSHGKRCVGRLSRGRHQGHAS